MRQVPSCGWISPPATVGPGFWRSSSRGPGLLTSTSMPTGRRADAGPGAPGAAAAPLARAAGLVGMVGAVEAGACTPGSRRRNTSAPANAPSGSGMATRASLGVMRPSHSEAAAQRHTQSGKSRLASTKARSAACWLSMPSTTRTSSGANAPLQCTAAAQASWSSVWAGARTGTPRAHASADASANGRRVVITFTASLQV